ncbi:MAG: aminotransferase class I/II-fold pyridoxal phosphate-dependent enzyme [Actinomycetota bacterium]
MTVPTPPPSPTPPPQPPAGAPAHALARVPNAGVQWDVEAMAATLDPARVPPAGTHEGDVDGVAAATLAPARVPAAGAHGGDVEAVAAALGWEPGDILDLSASFNPDAPDLAALAAGRLDSLERYPDPTAATAAMAEALGTSPDCILLTNGGAEAIALVANDLGRAAVPAPEFSLYARHLAAVVDPAEDPAAPLIRSNPNNPTGRLARPTDAATVWDEAFYPLAAGVWSRGDVAAGRAAMAIGSLTKVFACPGLRVGYVHADPAVIARLADRQPRWSLNGLAAALLPELLARAELREWAAATARRRAALVGAIPGVEPSDANFALVRVEEGAPAARAGLARHGVLVRDCTSFGLPGHIRVAVPDEAGLDRLVAAWERR